VNRDLERSEASPRPRISLCCITGGPLNQVAAILRLYRPVVDEIVVAVNGRFTQEELQPLIGLADRIVPCEMREDFLQERYRAWLYGQCSGEFICTVDTDEVPSAALLAALPELASARDVVTYLTACRWCFPDLEHWLDEYPWEPSWKMILVRNDPATLHIKGGVHEGVMAVAPYRFVELPIYHLSDATMSREARAAKVAFYDGLDGNQLLEDGRPVSEVFYLPEHSALYAPAPIPEEDVALIQQVLRADISQDRVLERESATGEPVEMLVGTVAYETILASWPERPLSLGAYNVDIQLRRGRTPQRDLTQMHPGEVRPMMVLLTNQGDATLLRESRNRVALSARFFTRDINGHRQLLVREGGRFAFAADLHPGQQTLLPFEVHAPEVSGDYLLVVDLVEENVRWFESGYTTAVRVSTEATGDGDEKRPPISPANAESSPLGVGGAELTAARTSPKRLATTLPEPTSLRIQSVLYCPPRESLDRYPRALGQTIRTLTHSRPDLRVDVAFADNSPSPVYSNEGIEEVRASFAGTGLSALTYEHFPENLGHGGAHNRLYSHSEVSDLIVILNPDTCPSPTLLLELLAALDDGVGIVEARQLPLEHQKAYDPETGDTSWASGACSLVRREVFEATGGYDDMFFLYCDDVDFSWRARLAGFRVVYQPEATCFHDKRLSAHAKEQPSDTEVFHSGLAGLLLAAKYSRPDLVESQLHYFLNSSLPIHADIVEAFHTHQREGRLATPIDPGARVADFSTYAYAPLRFDYER
jgi:GT2 family glycosyltransferase